jgi:hypothetical protein
LLNSSAGVSILRRNRYVRIFGHRRRSGFEHYASYRRFDLIPKEGSTSRAIALATVEGG